MNARGFHLGQLYSRRTIVGFVTDIRPLFRQQDIDAMTFVFDLGDYEAVKANAPAIYARLADGSMPCDGAWPQDRIALFQQWMNDGCKP
jgi:hypothetical protein